MEQQYQILGCSMHYDLLRKIKFVGFLIDGFCNKRNRWFRQLVQRLFYSQSNQASCNHDDPMTSLKRSKIITVVHNTVDALI